MTHVITHCEICQEEATVRCEKCQAFVYCSEKHREKDKVSHEKYCKVAAAEYQKRPCICTSVPDGRTMNFMDTIRLRNENVAADVVHGFLKYTLPEKYSEMLKLGEREFVATSKPWKGIKVDYNDVDPLDYSREQIMFQTRDAPQKESDLKYCFHCYTWEYSPAGRKTQALYAWHELHFEQTVQQLMDEHFIDAE